MVVTRMRPFKLRAYFFVGGKMNVIDILEERGFIDQMTHEEELRDLLEKEKVKFYIGFDATADSLTLGHFLQIRVMQHMQRA